QPACLDQCFSFGPEPRGFSGGMPQFGRICAKECAIKTGLRRRSSRRLNMMARRNPVRAPRNPSVIERLLNVRRPCPARTNPVYAIAPVQKIARTFMGPHTSAGFPRQPAKYRSSILGSLKFALDPHHFGRAGPSLAIDTPFPLAFIQHVVQLL